MDKLPIALQLYSVREDMKKDFKGTLRQIKKMGYEGVELAGLYDRSFEEVKAILSEVGLKIVSAHVPFIDLIENTEVLVKGYHDLGCMQIVIPYITEEYRPGNEKYAEFVEGIKHISLCCSKHGMTLAYHNHDFEFEKLDGRYFLDILYEDLPENILKTQLDTCWIKVAGENPVDYIKKYKWRQPTIHLKDFKGFKSEKMYGLLGIDDTKQLKEKQEFSFMPLGTGYQEIPDIIKAAIDAGVKWAIVEQDSPSMGKTPIKCAEASINYYKSL